MRKSDLEAKIEELQKSNSIFKDALIRIRQNARDCVDSAQKGTPLYMSNTWAIEKTTEALTKGML